MNFYSESDITRVLKLLTKMVLIDVLVPLIALRRCDVLLHSFSVLLYVLQFCKQSACVVIYEISTIFVYVSHRHLSFNLV